MARKNVVIAGDHVGMDVGYDVFAKKVSMSKLFGGETIYINKETVANYEVIDQNYNKSIGSGLVRGVVGGALLGGVGALAGVATTKSKGLHTVSIEFTDGTHSLCVLDDIIYKRFLQAMY